MSDIRSNGALHDHWSSCQAGEEVTPITSPVDSVKQSMLETEDPMGVAGQSKCETIGWSE